MNFDWEYSNWELYIGIGVALFIMLMVFFKQEIESYRVNQKPAAEAEKPGGSKKNTKKKGPTGKKTDL